MPGMKQFSIVVLAAVLACSSGGCLSLRLGGGGRKTTTENNSKNYSVTLGQQLMDLQQAHDNGVITDKQYEQQKKKLLKDYNR